MRRLLAPLLALGALSLVASACDASFMTTAARAAGQTISVSTVDTVLAQTTADPVFRCDVGSDVTGMGSSTYNSAYTASELSVLVASAIADGELTRLGLGRTAQADALAPQQLAAAFQPGSSSTCTGTGTEAVADLGTTFRSALVDYQADQDVLAAYLAGVSFDPTGFAVYVRAHPSAVEDCVSAILVKTKALAGQLRAEAAAGAPFASLAKQNSIDSSSAPNGGAIGCIAQYEFNPPLGPDVAKLHVGEVSPPIAFSGDWVLIKLTSQKPETAGEVENTIVQVENSAVQKLIARIDAHATVSVDPRYGTWAEHSGKWEVVPPSGPAQSLLPNATAVTPASLNFG